MLFGTFECDVCGKVQDLFSDSSEVELFCSDCESYTVHFEIDDMEID